MRTSAFTEPLVAGAKVVSLGGSQLLADLENRVLELTVRTLEHRGNTISAAHREALSHTSTIMTLVARGSLEGRHVIDLPTGSGKTTLLVCWTKVMMDLELGWSVAICAARVEELEDIFAELTSGELPVPTEAIGLWHTKIDARIPPTYTREEVHRYASKRILLLTHSRLDRSREVLALLRYQGSPRDLVIYDESLTATGVWTIPHTDVVGDIKRLCAKLAYDGPEDAFLRHLSDQLDEAVMSQAQGHAPAEIELSHRELLEAVSLLALRELGVKSALGQFLSNPEAGVRPLVVKDDVGNSSLIRTYVQVPDELNRMVVLDASFPVRPLLKLANERFAPAVPWQLRLTLAREGWPWFDTRFKRYDHVTVHLMPTRRSGREFAIDDMSMSSGTIDKEVASVVAEIPRDEGVLIWTFLSKPRMPDFAKQLRLALRDAGVDP
jgi:hypothetical protein